MFYDVYSRKGSLQACRLLYRTFWATLPNATNPVATVHVYPSHRLGMANLPIRGTQRRTPGSQLAGRTRKGINAWHSHPKQQKPRREASPQDEHGGIFFEFIKNLKQKIKGKHTQNKNFRRQATSCKWTDFGGVKNYHCNIVWLTNSTEQIFSCSKFLLWFVWLVNIQI